MARRGLFSPDQVADQTTQRNFARVKDAFEKVSADHDVISAPVRALIATAPIPTGASIVTYSGGPSQSLTLPPANAQGVTTAAVIVFLNLATVAVTLLPDRGDSLNGTTSLSVAAGTMRVLASDGNNRWLST